MTTSRDENGLGRLLDDLRRCVRCGECRSVCPVFAELREEKYSARGKLSLIEATALGNIDVDDALYQALGNCLQCQACQAQCGSGTPACDIIRAGREAFVRRRGVAAARRILMRGLAAGDPAMRAAARVQPALFKNIPRSSGLRRRFPLPYVARDQPVPRLASTPFLEQARVAGPGDASSVRDQALLYVGCMANYMYTDVAAAAVKVLGAVGVRVRLPGEHACCGAPMDAAGDAAAALSQARKNLAILGDSGIPVLTICASGGVMLRERYRALVAGDKDLESVASRLAQRTMDLSAYLVHVVGVERIARAMQTKAAPLETRVTWHDPCHLARGQGVRSEPRELLRLAVGQRFVEMTDPDRCCGLAGTYFLAHPKTSRAIRERKSAAIEESGAGVVATACPGCMFQIQGGLADRPSQARVLHLAQILAMAMGKSLHTPAHPTGETT